jgi:hypothetical protein
VTREASSVLRVRVVVEVEVDRDDYEAEYGESATAEQIRAHVKGSIGTAAESAFERIDAVRVVDWH